MGVTIPLRQGTASLAAPWSAIVFDADGGAWVYEQTGAATFVRRRVQVERAVGDVAVLVSGVRPGARVVATGAAELFGVEFGVRKVMRWLVTTALRHRFAVLTLAALLALFGVHAARETPLDVFPEFAPPLVEVQTEAPGLSTEEVESLVTAPLESALNGTAWLKTLRSKSVLGLSSVVCLFQEGADLMRARQLVQERVAMIAPRLPAVARPPVILPPLSSTSRLMKIGLSSPTLSQMDLSELALWTIRPRLMAVPGVANVAIWGQRDRQLQVRVDPHRLAANGVTLDAVVRAAGDAAMVTAGGFIDLPNQRLPVRHLAPIVTPQDLARTVVQFAGGVALRLGDVAEIVEGHPPPIGDAVVNDGPGLLLIVEKQPWGNTLEVTRQVETALDALRPALAGVDIDPAIFRPATFIERALGHLTHAMILGCVLVVIVLVAFLFEWRTALISMTAIPLSLLAAATGAAFAAAARSTRWRWRAWSSRLGEVVDDAIIDVENILRRLATQPRRGTASARLPGRARRLARSSQRRGLSPA